MDLRAVRSSIFVANSLNFPETSRKNDAVRRSVSGATSSSRYLRRRATSSSIRRPISSNLSMCLCLPAKSRSDLGIIETLHECRKEDCWRFPINGNGGSTN